MTPGVINRGVRLRLPKVVRRRTLPEEPDDAKRFVELLSIEHGVRVHPVRRVRAVHKPHGLICMYERPDAYGVAHAVGHFVFFPEELCCRWRAKRC